MVLYKNVPDKFKLTKGTILSLSSIYLILIVGIFLLIYFQTDQVHIKYYFYIIIGITEISILGFSFFNVLKKLKHSYLNYTLTIQEDLISCTKQSFIPAISIPKSQISAITEDQYGNLTIKGTNPKLFITILPYLQHFDEVKLQLEAIKPITFQAPTKNFFEKYPQILLVITIGSMVIIYTSYNKILVGLFGVLLLVLLIWSFYSIQKNKQIEKKLKSNSWWILVVLFSVIAIIYYKVFVL